MGVFRFKEFEVRNEVSAMKVNTDSVLLGVLCTVRKEDRRVLDIGTGTGAVALIVAQRLNRVKGGVPRGNVLCSGDCITGIDIDEGAASEAAFNFGGSPWANNMEALMIFRMAVTILLYRIPHIMKTVSSPPWREGELPGTPILYRIETYFPIRSGICPRMAGWLSSCLLLKK